MKDIDEQIQEYGDATKNSLEPAPTSKKCEGFVHTQARTSPVFPHNHPLPRLQGSFWGNLAERCRDTSGPSLMACAKFKTTVV